MSTLWDYEVQDIWFNSEPFHAIRRYHSNFWGESVLVGYFQNENDAIDILRHLQEN
jgi:hypothetical protein